MKSVEEIRKEFSGTIGKGLSLMYHGKLSTLQMATLLLSTEVGGEVSELEDKYDECNGRKIARPKTLRDLLEER